MTKGKKGKDKGYGENNNLQKKRKKGNDISLADSSYEELMEGYLLFVY